MSDTPPDAMNDSAPSSSTTPSVPTSASTALLVSQQNDATEPRRRTGWRGAGLVWMILFAALAAGVWFVWQQWQQQEARWSEQWTQNRAATVAAQTQAQRALDVAEAQATLLARVQADQARLLTQLQGLEHTVEVITPLAGNDNAAMRLGEVASLVEIAQQSLRLGGNVSTALVALESAQNRVSQSPALAGVQQALQEDIHRLRAVPLMDVGDVNRRLARLSALLAQAPPLTPATVGQAQPEPRVDAPAVVETSPAYAALPWWQVAWQQTRVWFWQAWDALAQELRALVTVRRIDDTAALLLSPEQVVLLRDTLQARVAAARLALLMREPAIWADALASVQHDLAVRFDTTHATGQEAQAVLRTLLDTAIRVDLPTLEASVRAVQTQRAVWSRSSAAPSGQEQD